MPHTLGVVLMCAMYIFFFYAAEEHDQCSFFIED